MTAQNIIIAALGLVALVIYAAVWVILYEMTSDDYMSEYWWMQAEAKGRRRLWERRKDAIFTQALIRDAEYRRSTRRWLW
jgi:hypothetical protein